MSKHHDVIVVGGGLSATIAAALLAKRGFRGLLIDQGELSVTEGDTLFDLIPSEEGSAAMRIVHGELAVREDLRIKVEPVDPLLQVIFWDARLDLSADPTRFNEELRRRLQSDAEVFARLAGPMGEADLEAGEMIAAAGELPPTGFFAKRSFASTLRKHGAVLQSVKESESFTPDDGPLWELMLGLLPFLSHLDCRRPGQASVARFARILCRLLRGMSRFSDGRSLRSLFVDLAERKGFTVERGAAATIEKESKKFSLQLSGRRDRISCDYLVDASADLSGLDVLTKKKKDLLLLLQAAKPTGWLHGFGLDVDDDVLPPGLAPNVLLLNGRKDPSRFDQTDPESEDRPIFVTVKPTGEKRSRLLTTHPLTSARAHSQRIEQIETMLRARLARVIPFLDRGHPEPVHVEMSHPLFRADLDEEAGLLGVPFRTGEKNIFLGGPAVLPGLGVEGAYLSALQAADAIDTVARKTKHPKTLAERV